MKYSSNSALSYSWYYVTIVFLLALSVHGDEPSLYGFSGRSVSYKDYCDAAVCKTALNCWFFGGKFKETQVPVSRLIFTPSLSDKNKEYALEWDADNFDRQVVLRDSLIRDCNNYCRLNFVCGKSTPEADLLQREEVLYRSRSTTLQREILHLQAEVGRIHDKVVEIETKIGEVDVLIKGQLHSEGQLTGELKELKEGIERRTLVVEQLQKQEDALIGDLASYKIVNDSNKIKEVDDNIKFLKINMLSVNNHLAVVANWIKVLSTSRFNVSEDIRHLVASYHGLVNSKHVLEEKEDEYLNLLERKELELADLRKLREKERRFN